MPSMPPLILMRGSFDAYIDEVYGHFTRSILTPPIATFRGLPVRPRRTPEYDNKEFGFWHMTSEGRVEEDRTPDLRRCERINWIRWMIDNWDHADVSCWEEQRDGKTEIVLWLESLEYVVILAERTGYWVLKTAYLATKSGKIRQLTNSRARNT